VNQIDVRQHVVDAVYFPCAARHYYCCIAPFSAAIGHASKFKRARAQMPTHHHPSDPAEDRGNAAFGSASHHYLYLATRRSPHEFGSKFSAIPVSLKATLRVGAPSGHITNDVGLASRKQQWDEAYPRDVW
jgi:hypothetical protein